MVDGGGKHIHQQDGKHHTLGITGVHHTDDDGHRTNDETVDPLAGLRATRGDGVGSHKHSTEGEAAQHQVFIPGDGGHLGCTEDQGHHNATHEDAQHGLPRSNARQQQDAGTDGDSDNAGLTDTAGDESGHHVAVERHVNILANLAQRGCHCETVGQCVAQSEDLLIGHPHGIAAHLRRIGEEEECTTD